MDACIHICILLFCVIRRLWRWFLMCFAHIKNQAWLVIYVRSTSRTKHGLLYMCEAHQEPSMACYIYASRTSRTEHGLLYICISHVKNRAWLVIYVRNTSRTEHGLLYMCEAHQETSMACYKIRVKKQIEYGKIFLCLILYFMGKINYMRREIKHTNSVWRSWEKYNLLFGSCCR